LYGTALVLEEFGDVIARGGAGVVIKKPGLRGPKRRVSEGDPKGSRRCL
jgi:hypothetical protein